MTEINQWRPMGDPELPKNGTYVALLIEDYVYNKTIISPVVSRYRDGDWERYSSYKILGWYPIPPIP